MVDNLFDKIDLALPGLTAAEAVVLVQGLLSRLGLAALRMNAAEEKLLLPVEAAEIARVPKRRVSSWARAAGASEWACWMGERGLLVREGAWRRFLQTRNEDLTRAKRQRARQKRLRRAARKG